MGGPNDKYVIVRKANGSYAPVWWMSRLENGDAIVSGDRWLTLGTATREAADLNVVAGIVLS